MALTDGAARTAKPRGKPYKLGDRDGLYLLVHPKGGRYWRYKYRIAGHEKVLAIGTYPDVSLAIARGKLADARRLVATGKDPSEAKREEKAAHTGTFAEVAQAWLSKQSSALSDETVALARGRLDTYVLPMIGRKPIRSIGASDVLAMLQRIERKGINETAHRVRSLVSRVFRFAVASKKADDDPTRELSDALAPVAGEHYAAVTDPRKVGELLRAIDGYVGQPTTALALRLAPHVFLRPGELRAGEWTEINFTAKQWRVPGVRMKVKVEHIVPLSKQAVAILRELQTHSGDGQLMFPSMTDASRPMSDNTLNAALRRIGYGSNDHVAHGFRRTASTILNEQGFNRDWIERQLAHGPKDRVRAAYNAAEYLPQRTRMMQTFSDHLDALKAGGAPD